MSRFESLTVERAGGVVTVTLCRPEVQNRFDDMLVRETVSVLRELHDDAGARAVVLASTGTVFSAGGDFELMHTVNADPRARAALIDNAKAFFSTLLDLPQPVIAAVQGAAIGAGANVALACDLVVASRNVKIADPHASIGLVAGEGGTIFWPLSVGLHRARRHLLTGDPMDAAAAHTYGLVTDLVDEPADVLPVATALAEKIAAMPPLSIRGTKKLLNRIAQSRAAELLDLGLMLEERTLASADLLEAVASFKERRPGRYEGV